MLSECHSYCLISIFFCKDELTDLKLVTGDTIDNVATLQDCSVGQEESVQLLGENLNVIEVRVLKFLPSSYSNIGRWDKILQSLTH